MWAKLLLEKIIASWSAILLCFILGFLLRPLLGFVLIWQRRQAKKEPKKASQEVYSRQRVEGHYLKEILVCRAPKKSLLGLSCLAFLGFLLCPLLGFIVKAKKAKPRKDPRRQVKKYTQGKESNQEVSRSHRKQAKKSTSYGPWLTFKSKKGPKKLAEPQEGRPTSWVPSFPNSDFLSCLLGLLLTSWVPSWPCVDFLSCLFVHFR